MKLSWFWLIKQELVCRVKLGKCLRKSRTRRTVSVKTTPGNIPTEIVVDVTDLDLFQAITVKDLQLPEGVEATLSPSLTLAIVLEDRRAAKEAADKAAAEAAPAAKKA